VPTLTRFGSPVPIRLRSHRCLLGLARPVATGVPASFLNVSLLREIQRGAADASVPLSDLLRKTKILAARLDNTRLADWVEKELNGYAVTDDLPPYRRVGPTRVIGDFSGFAGSGLRNAEIPSALVEADDRERLFYHRFIEGIAHYETLLGTASEGATFAVPWPGNALIKYGDRVYEGMSMMGAHQQLTNAAIAGMLDTVRNRLLDLALELERENPDAGDAPIGTQPVPQAKVDQIVQQIVIQGGTNTIGAGPVSQVIANITAGPAWEELREQLLRAGLGADEVRDLEQALDADAAEVERGEIGPVTRGWLRRAADHAGEIGSNVSTEVLTGLILKLLNSG
jgi:hypothetical protein